MVNPSRRSRAIVVVSAATLLAIVASTPPVRSRAVGPTRVILPVATARVPAEHGGPSASPWLGSGSCAASSCHGSIAPVPGMVILGNEHTTWISHDPHARAYQVLLNRRSERIARNLAGGAEILPAHRDPRCLACHSTPRPESFRVGTEWMDADGVGCESCHGPARDWIGPHTTEAWRAGRITRPPTFWATDDLETRARTCTGCHIGRHEPDDGLARDVNHDLIAAGHPRLDFEFAAYHDRMPAHWVPKGDEANADFPARAWLIGQRVSIAETLALTEARAASSVGPWPEFAEYGCAGCHHDLTYKQPPTGSSGTYDWASWHGAGARTAAELGGAGAAMEEALGPFATLMNRPVPDRAEVVESARVTRERAAEALVAPASLDAATLRSWVDRLDGVDARGRPTDWDREAQRYLALVPIFQALARLGADADELARVRGRIDALWNDLRAARDGFGAAVESRRSRPHDAARGQSAMENETQEPLVRDSAGRAELVRGRCRP